MYKKKPNKLDNFVIIDLRTVSEYQEKEHGTILLKHVLENLKDQDAQVYEKNNFIKRDRMFTKVSPHMYKYRYYFAEEKKIN